MQLYADTVLDMTHMASRVEHVVSGQVGHFHSLAALLVLLTRVFGERETVGRANVDTGEVTVVAVGLESPIAVKFNSQGESTPRSMSKV